MAFAHEKRDAARILDALENGSLPIEDTRSLLEDADPVLVYVFFAWLRKRYHPGHSASDGVLGRIVEVCKQSPAVASMARAGERDAIAEWLRETYDYADLDRDELIEVVVDKLEG